MNQFAKDTLRWLLTNEPPPALEFRSGVVWYACAHAFILAGWDGIAVTRPGIQEQVTGYTGVIRGRELNYRPQDGVLELDDEPILRPATGSCFRDFTRWREALRDAKATFPRSMSREALLSLRDFKLAPF